MLANNIVQYNRTVTHITTIKFPDGILLRRNFLRTHFVINKFNSSIQQKKKNKQFSHDFFQWIISRIRFWKKKTLAHIILTTKYTVLLVKLLISNWLHIPSFDLAGFIDEFTAKNNNMRLCTIFLYTYCNYDCDTQLRKNVVFCTVLFTTKEILCTIQQNINFTFVLSVSILMVCF